MIVLAQLETAGTIWQKCEPEDSILIDGLIASSTELIRTACSTEDKVHYPYEVQYQDNDASL